VPDDAGDLGVPILSAVDPLDRLRWAGRSAGRRMTDPLESLAERVVDLLVQALDVNALVGRVDLNALLARVDVNELLARVDVPALVDRVDVNQVLRRVDLDALLARVDVNALAGRVDVNQVLRRVDLDALLARVDVNALAGRIDMDALVEETDLGAVIAQSSGGIASEALDAARSQAVGLDKFIDRWVGRALRRKHPGPAAPPTLLDAAAGPGGSPR